MTETPNPSTTEPTQTPDPTQTQSHNPTQADPTQQPPLGRPPFGDHGHHHGPGGFGGGPGGPGHFPGGRPGPSREDLAARVAEAVTAGTLTQSDADSVLKAFDAGVLFPR